MDKELETFQGFVDGLMDQWLSGYLSQLGTRKSPPRQKEINDAIWGTLQLLPEEVVYLDSPLLQRLRRIRQLGVVHYVYPAATHSRLEHSLGALHQVQSLVTSVNAHGLEGQKPTDGRVISLELERLLRIAALCHDIGHGFMSHVSEYGLEYSRRVADVRALFDEKYRGQRPGNVQLSEMAASYMVRSPAFTKLAGQAAELAGLGKISDIGDKLSRLILGLRVDDRLVLLHEFISGPFDADKLDYLTRDATMCGVPRVTDTPRLVQKVRAVQVARDQLTSTLKKTVHVNEAFAVVTGIAASGGRTVDELALARSLMFDKVYRHHKVRAVESMVFAMVEALSRLVDPPYALPYLFTDDEIIALEPELLIGKLGLPPDAITDEQQLIIDFICDLALRLRSRDLFTRGLAYGALMTGDAYAYDATHNAGIKEFLEDCGKATTRSQFVRSVAERVIGMNKILGYCELPADVDRVITSLWLSPHRGAPRTASSDTGRAHLVYPDGRIMQVVNDAAETVPWADAYVATRDLGLLFCPAEIAPLVYVAGEAELRVRYGIHLPDSMRQFAKLDAAHVSTIRRELTDAGWYDELPLDLRPLPEILTRGDAPDRIRAVVGRLADYSGPDLADRAGESSHTRSVIRDEQVTAFVRQFGSDELIDTALDVLSNVKVIGRPEGNAALRSFLTQNPGWQDGRYAALGEAKDSSSLLTYYVGDSACEFGLEYGSLPEALNSGVPVLFVDDFIGTGSQVVDIFEAWLDLPRSKKLGEHRDPLAPELREMLKNRPIALVFVAGMAEGARAAEAALQALGLDVTVWVHTTEAELPFLDTIGLEAGRLTNFKAACVQVGAEVLATWDDKNRDEPWLENKVLGYGNLGLLLTSTFNTQTATLSCLWAHNPTSPWQPLLPRRTKL